MVKFVPENDPVFLWLDKLRRFRKSEEGELQFEGNCFRFNHYGCHSLKNRKKMEQSKEHLFDNRGF